MTRRTLLPLLACLLACFHLTTTATQASTLVVANKAGASVSLIDLASGDVVATLPTGVGPHEVAVSPDGTKALITNYGRRLPGCSLTLIDIPTATVLRTLDLGEYERPHGVLWLRDGKRAVVTAEADRALLTVEIESGEILQAVDTAQEISHMVALTADQKRAFVANIGSGSVTVIDLEKGERVANVETGEGAEGVAVTVAGRVWVTNRAADTITVLDATSLEELGEFASEGFPIRATATPAGKVLVTHARAGALTVFEDATSANGEDAGALGQGVRRDLQLTGKFSEDRLFSDRFGDSSVPIGVVVDGDGTLAYIAHANADVITEVDVATGKTLRTLTAGAEPDGMAWSSSKVSP